MPAARLCRCLILVVFAFLSSAQSSEPLRPRAARHAPPPFINAQFVGPWWTTACLDQTSTEGVFEISISEKRKVTGTFWNEFDESLPVKGLVSRAGVIRAKVDRRTILNGMVIVNPLNRELTVQGFFSGTCAGVFTSATEPPSCTTCTNQPPVTNSVPLFKDTNLLNAVAEELDLPANDIQIRDLRLLTYLSAWDVYDLSGLEYATNLNSIYLTGTLTNSVALRSLPRLQRIYGYEFSSFDSLTNALAVQELSVSSSAASDFAPILWLTNLTYLSLSSGVTNGSLATNLVKLESLSLPGISNFNAAGLAFMPRLASLNLESCGITDTTPLGTLTNLQNLYLNNNPLTNLSPLGSLRKLQALYLSDCGITNLSWLNAPLLQTLSLTRNLVTDLTPVAACALLQSLYVRNNPVGDISALSGLKQIRYLDISGCGLTTIQPLASMPFLYSVYMSSNAVADLSPIAGAALSRLEISWTAVTNLSVLPSFTSWSYFTAQGLGLTDLSTLRPGSLYSVDFSHNALTNVAGLTAYPRLQDVNLSYNQISDISPLLDLTELRYVTLNNNPLNLSAGSAASNIVSTLRTNGVNVWTGGGFFVLPPIRTAPLDGGSGVILRTPLPHARFLEPAP